MAAAGHEHGYSRGKAPNVEQRGCVQVDIVAVVPNHQQLGCSLQVRPDSCRNQQATLSCQHSQAKASSSDVAKSWLLPLLAVHLDVKG